MILYEYDRGSGFSANHPFIYGPSTVLKGFGPVPVEDGQEVIYQQGVEG